MAAHPPSWVTRNPSGVLWRGPGRVSDQKRNLNSLERRTMSIEKLHTFAIATLLLVAGAMFVGCALKSEPPPPPPPAAPPPPPPATLSQIKSELLAAKAQMDVTNASLNDLAKSSGPNAQANYDKFTTEFDKFKTLAEVCRTRNDDLKFRTQAYFDQWNKQAEIANPELRAARPSSASRRRIPSTASRPRSNWPGCHSTRT